ncbi:MAG: hypothetical protein ACI82J_001321, partial [Sulfitobacter litoralis]
FTLLWAKAGVASIAALPARKARRDERVNFLSDIKCLLKVVTT